MGKRRVFAPVSSESEDSSSESAHDSDSDYHGSSGGESEHEMVPLSRLRRAGKSKPKGKSKAAPRRSRRTASSTVVDDDEAEAAGDDSVEAANSRLPVTRSNAVATDAPKRKRGGGGAGASSSASGGNPPPAAEDMTLEELETEIAKKEILMEQLVLFGQVDTPLHQDADKKLRALKAAKDKKINDPPDERGYEGECPWDPNAPESTKRVTRSSRVNLASNPVPQPKKGSATAVGQVAVTKPKPGKKAKPNPKPRVYQAVGRIQRKLLTPKLYERYLSAEPLWQLANKYKSGTPFPEPPAEERLLHRRVFGNVSGFMGGDPMQGAIAYIVMMLTTCMTKMPFFGTDQGMGENGGPYYMCGKTCVPPPRDYGKHAEVTVKGWTQMSKSPEQAMQCFVDFFVRGCLPTMWLRLKGGASTGTADAAKAIYEMNELVQEIFDKMIDDNSAFKDKGLQRSDRDKITLKPRCASKEECIEFKGNGSYRLAEPQVLIACCNVVQLGPMMNPASKKKLKDQAAAGQPSDLPLCYIMAGIVKEGEDMDNNPYLPILWDYTRAGLPESEVDGRDRPLPAITATFDENELNRSTTGREAKENLLYGTKAVGAANLLNTLIASANVYEDDDDEEATDLGSEAEAARRDERTFSDTMHGLRASFAGIINYTATPTDNVYPADDPRVSSIVPYMFEMVASKCYIGFSRERLTKTSWWCERFVEIEELPDRVHVLRLAKTWHYKKVGKKLLNVDINMETGEGLPSALSFRICNNTGNPVISYHKKNAKVVVGETEEGATVTAEAFAKTVARSAKATFTNKTNKFWNSDGNNAYALLKHAATNKEAYPEGYRNMLMISNYTREAKQKENWVTTLLGIAQAAQQEGMDYDPRDLAMDLITVEWDHRYVRASWGIGFGVDECCLREAVEWMEVTGGDTSNQAAKEGAKEFARKVRWYKGSEELEAAEDEDDDAPVKEVKYGCLMSPVSNINYMFTILHKYKELNEAACKERDEGAFLKIFTIAGEICGRSVRMKSHDKHKFVLTDMLFLFNANPRNVVTMHIISALQAVGRLCTMVPDPASAPPIKLWTSESNWAFLGHWMDVIDELVPLHDFRAEDETLDEALDRMLKTPKELAPGFDRLRVHFQAPTGVGARGAEHSARIDGRIGKANTAFGKHRTHAVESGTAPEGVELVDHTDEYTDQMAELSSAIATNKTKGILDQDSDEEIESDEEVDQAFPAINLPGWEPVAVPKRANVPFIKYEKKRGHDGDSLDSYKFTEAEERAAFRNVDEMRAVRAKFPAGCTASTVPEELLLKLFTLWYGYFIHYKAGAQGVGDEGLHGLVEAHSRSKYVQGVKEFCTSPYVKKLSDLPQHQAHNPQERERIRALCGEVIEHLRPSNGAKNKKGIDMKTQHAYNMSSHLYKWFHLFPPRGGSLREWLFEAPPPKKAPKVAKAAEEEEGDAPDPSDEDGSVIV